MVIAHVTLQQVFSWGVLFPQAEVAYHHQSACHLKMENNSLALQCSSQKCLSLLPGLVKGIYLLKCVATKTAYHLIIQI